MWSRWNQASNSNSAKLNCVTSWLLETECMFASNFVKVKAMLNVMSAACKFNRKIATCNNNRGKEADDTPRSEEEPSPNLQLRKGNASKTVVAVITYRTRFLSRAFQVPFLQHFLHLFSCPWWFVANMVVMVHEHL